jgi:hypothetical protein
MPRRKRRKAVTRRRVGRRGMARRGRPPGGMAGALRSLHEYHGELVAQRGQLEAQIHAVENALSVMGGTPRAYAGRGRVGRPPGRRPGRPPSMGRAPRPGSLKAYILDVLSHGGGTMAVKDITSGVLSSGYKTKNRTLAKSVGIALTEMKNVTKVGRGKFRLR